MAIGMALPLLRATNREEISAGSVREKKGRTCDRSQNIAMNSVQGTAYLNVMVTL